MGDEAVMPAQRRGGGCLKWTCGCLVVAVVAGIGLLFLLWHYLNQWDSRRSPWENLPPSVTWALELHDIQALVVQAGRDPGFAPLVASLVGTLSRGIPGGDAWRSDAADGFASYQSLAWLHRAALPNALLIAGDHREVDNAFFVLQPPAWLRYFLSLSGSGDVVASLSDEDVEGFYAYKDDWLIFGMRQDVVQRVVDAWDSAAKPLGPRQSRRTAYVMAAVSPEIPEAPEAPSEPGHFAFADPFAQANAAAAATTADKPIPGFRFMIVPEADAWRLWGEASPAGSWLDESLAEAIPEPAGLRTADYDLAVSARFDPGSVELIRTRLAAALRPKQGTPPQDELFRTWLRDGWLGATGDAATLLAAPPLVHDDAYPGMPVTAFGWSLREGVSARAAADRFAALLEDFAESLREDGDAAVVRGLVDAFAVHVDADGRQGRVELPPVMVSGARLGWRFVDDEGWVATDASALSKLPDGRDIPLADLADSHAAMSEAAGAWVLSDAFAAGLGEWLRDRFEMTSVYAEMDEESRERLRLAEELVSRMFALYPRGAFRLRYDVSSGRGGINLRIPHGKAGE